MTDKFMITMGICLIFVGMAIFILFSTNNFQYFMFLVSALFVIFGLGMIWDRNLD